jgi:hypothetical protein
MKSVCNVPFSNLYLAQTILDLVGIPVKISQRSMAPVLKELEENYQEEVVAFMYEGYGGNARLRRISVIHGKNKLVFDGKNHEIFSIDSRGETTLTDWSEACVRLKSRAEQLFKEKVSQVKSQKIPARELERLKTLGYL